MSCTSGRVDDISEVQRAARKRAVAALFGEVLIAIFNAEQNLVADRAKIDVQITLLWAMKFCRVVRIFGLLAIGWKLVF